jgi:hypothetical protein
VSRVRIELAAGSRVRLIEQHAEDTPANCVVEIVLASDAVCEHIRISRRARQPRWNLVSVHVGEAANYSLAGYAMGGLPSRNDIHIHLDGPHARTDVNLACGNVGRDRLDHQIVVEHIGTIPPADVSRHRRGRERTDVQRSHPHPPGRTAQRRAAHEQNLLADRKARITKPNPKFTPTTSNAVMARPWVNSIRCSSFICVRADSTSPLRGRCCYVHFSQAD